MPQISLPSRGEAPYDGKLNVAITAINMAVDDLILNASSAVQNTTAGRSNLAASAEIRSAISAAITTALAGYTPGTGTPAGTVHIVPYVNGEWLNATSPPGTVYRWFTSFPGQNAPKYTGPSDPGVTDIYIEGKLT